MEILPEHIRASLAHYEKHRQCTCLQCGYTGLMGVHRTTKKVSIKTAGIVLAVLLGASIFMDAMRQLSGAPFPTWLGWIVGIGFVVWALQENIYLACPNCNTELLVK